MRLARIALCLVLIALGGCAPLDAGRPFDPSPRVPGPPFGG